MKYLFSSAVMFGASILILQSCSRAPVASDHVLNGPPASSSVLGEDTGKHVLAGEWEYEESGMVVPLRLDPSGNGTYDFKEGRFLTNLLSGHRWTGAWAQQANDREGGFEISLSPDYSEGDGRWWYTRIEGDTAPQKPGGRFHVMKVRSR